MFTEECFLTARIPFRKNQSHKEQINEPKGFFSLNTKHLQNMHT